MKKSELELLDIIEKSVENNNTISMKTYLLSDYGERILHLVTETILKKYNRIDLLEISYSSAKELVINATKANLKRVLYREKGLDINNPDDYEKGLIDFKDNLKEEKMLGYKSLFKQFDLPVTATFYYNKDVLNIKVKNNFPLLQVEEERIRDKFQKATSFTSLIDFFMEYGDATEGAGMGITMVGILLDQSGINKHCFSLYSSEKYNETAAKIEIPLSENYVSKRDVFEREQKEKGLNTDDFRKSFHYNYKQFGK